MKLTAEISGRFSDQKAGRHTGTFSAQKVNLYIHTKCANKCEKEEINWGGVDWIHLVMTGTSSWLL
jgi:hypothetical protein